MEALSRHRRDPDVVVPAIAALAAGVTTAWTISQRMVLKYDSIYYLSAAENLAHGHGLTDYAGRQLTNFPPGYPLLIRLLMVVGLGSTSAASVIAVVSSVLIVALTAVLAARLGPRGSASFAALVAAALPSVLTMNIQVMSEPIFTVSLLTLVIFLLRLPSPPAPITMRDLAPAILATWVCCLLRYQGYGLIAVGALVLFLRPATFPRRILLAAKYSVTSAIAVGLIVLQSRIRSESFGAPMTSAQGQTGSDLRRGLESIGRMFRVNRHVLEGSTNMTVGIIVICLFVVAVGAGVGLGWTRRRSGSFLTVTAFVLIIPIVALMAARRVWVELTPRILFPSLPLVIVLIVAAAGLALQRSQAWVKFVAMGIAIALVIPAAIQTGVDASEQRVDVSDYYAPERLAPELGRAVADLPASALVYSNNSEGIWLSSRRPEVQRLESWISLARKLVDNPFNWQMPEQLEPKLWSFVDDLCVGFYLALTEEENPDRFAGELSSLNGIATVTTVKEFDHGTLYAVENLLPELCQAAAERPDKDR